MTSNDSPKLIINPVGGLANRMRALASGLALASRLECDIKVIWRRNWELNARMEDVFQLPTALKGKISYPSKFTYDSLYSIPRKRNLYISGPIGKLRFGATLRDATEPLRPLIRDNDFSAIEKLCQDSLLKGKDCLLQGGTNIYPYTPDLYKSLFKPSEEVERKVEGLKERLGGKTVGIHIRRTDNAQSILHSPDSLFIAQMDKILEEAPGTTFYLATDDEATKSKFRAIYKDRIVTSETEADRGSVEGIIEAAAEMYMLASADRIIGSFYSSFSEAAAMLGGKPFSQVYSGE